MEETIKNLKKESVHWVSAHSYVMYFVLFLVGFSLDMVFKFKIFPDSTMMPIGTVFLVLATMLIFWTERSSIHLGTENITKESFCRGPYCYTRVPIHWGLFLLMFGFGLLINAFFVIVSTIVSFLIGKFVFQKKAERILEKKYGAHYIEYKKLVRF